MRPGQPRVADPGQHAGEVEAQVSGTLVLVHTVPPLVEAFAGWCAELLPGVRLLHILDEPLLEQIRRRGSWASEDEDRLAGHVALAEALGADAVLVTCSTVSLGVDVIRPRFSIPVVTIDHEMAREAVQAGTRIALVATAATTIEPSTGLLLAAGRAAGRTVLVTSRLVDGALPALLTGDRATHDRLVEAAVRDAAADNEVVVLAQATMTSVLAAMGDRPVPVPVLASPLLALREVGRIFEARDSALPTPARDEVTP
jgi:aspartate/glutamate racemase